MHWIKRLAHERLLIGFALLAIVLAIVDPRPLATYQRWLQLPTLADSPEIAIDLIDSDAEPFDPGEIGVVAVAPAVANALFSANGLRLRRLPLQSGAA